MGVQLETAFRIATPDRIIHSEMLERIDHKQNDMERLLLENEMFEKYLKHFSPEEPQAQKASSRSTHSKLHKQASVSIDRPAVVTIAQKCNIAQFCRDKQTEELRHMMDEMEKEKDNLKVLLEFLTERSVELQKSKHTFQKLVVEQEPCTIEQFQKYLKLMYRRRDAAENKLRLNSTDQRIKLKELKGRVESIKESDEGVELIDIEYARVINKVRRRKLAALQMKILRRKSELTVLIGYLRVHSRKLEKYTKELEETNFITNKRYTLAADSDRMLRIANLRMNKLLLEYDKVFASEPEYKMPTPGQFISVVREKQLLDKALPVARKRLAMSRALFKKHKQIWSGIRASKK